jgi:nicotinamide-nucleotide adenylyltransferase
MKQYERVGIVGRFKPLNNSGHRLLEQLLSTADELVIGIGSCKSYDVRNPFTAEETHEMIERCLRPRNYSVLYIPDFGHLEGGQTGELWTQYVLGAYGELDAFYTGNPYVAALLAPHYTLIGPAQQGSSFGNPPWIKSSRVRYEMAKGGDWESLVPCQVSDFLKSAGLLERFKQEFGQATLLAAPRYQSSYRLEKEDVCNPAHIALS